MAIHRFNAWAPYSFFITITQRQMQQYSQIDFNLVYSTKSIEKKIKILFFISTVTNGTNIFVDLTMTFEYRINRDFTNTHPYILYTYWHLAHNCAKRLNMMSMNVRIREYDLQYSRNNNYKRTMLFLFNMLWNKSKCRVVKKYCKSHILFLFFFLFILYDYESW